MLTAITDLGTGWLLVLGVAVLVSGGLLVWVARHVGGSTREGDAFMTDLGRSPSRFIRPGSGR